AVASHGRFYAPTLQLSTQFLTPVTPGRVRCEARCVRLGRTIAHVEGVLFDSDGEPAATAAACARVIPFDRARSL
ncbi:MAG: PaaI family thioesterase, partial [Caulobacterales bacterium]|nr:PaaI family thioesterase [Caulobacterales bacterium]